MEIPSASSTGPANPRGAEGREPNESCRKEFRGGRLGKPSGFPEGPRNLESSESAQVRWEDGTSDRGPGRAGVAPRAAAVAAWLLASCAGPDRPEAPPLPATGEEWRAYADRHPDQFGAGVYAAYDALSRGAWQEFEARVHTLEKLRQENAERAAVLGVLHLHAAERAPGPEERRRTLGRAAYHLEAAYRARPEDPLGSYHLALTRYRRGELEEAGRLVETHLRNHPADLAARRLAGRVHLDRNDPGAALRHLEAIPEAARTPADLETFGLAYYLMSQFARAEEWFRQAAARDPSNARICRNLALALQELGRQDESREWFDKARALEAPPR